MSNPVLQKLIQKGVRIPNPDSVYVSDDVDPERICGEDVTLFGGTKLIGPRCLILKGCRLGYETPVTLENTLVGEGCDLKGGFFKDAVFAGHNSMGSGAHVREGTIFEEQANAAHTVGLKQTILFPFVTLGSLINFCDCFMAGGTSRKNHSEVGSSFIHFNYTPNQDKATPSMMGNVHQGVMLASRPIFLGGQGGLVGPLKVAYGCVTAAGCVIRKDLPDPDHLAIGGGFREMAIPRKPFVYSNVSRIFNRNISYISALISLRAWYHHVRRPLMSDGLAPLLFEGMFQNLETCIRERIKRFSDFGMKLERSRKNLVSSLKTRKGAALEAHDSALSLMEPALIRLNQAMAANYQEEASAFLAHVSGRLKESGNDYILFIKGLSEAERLQGSAFLQDLEQSVSQDLLLAEVKKAQP